MAGNDTIDLKMSKMDQLLNDLDRLPLDKLPPTEKEVVPPSSPRKAAVDTIPDGYTITDTQHLAEGFGGSVLIDSGTGESKVMFIKENDEGEVAVEELKILPSLKDIQNNPNMDVILQGCIYI